jgi:site-specific recombinase XerC
MPNVTTLKLQDAVEQFMDEKYAGKENSTPAGPKKRLRLFVNFLGGGEQSLVEVDDKIDLEKFKLHLQKRESKYRGKKEVKGRLSPFYIRGILINVRCFVQWLHQKKFLKRDLAKGFIVPPMPLPHPKPVMEKDVRSLLKAAERSPHHWKSVRDKAIIQTFRASGGRVGGLVSANIDDCDLQERRLIVTEKGDIQRAIFLSPTATKAMRAWLKEREKLKPKDNALFIGGHGRRLTPIGIKRGFGNSD